jgi:hypothetical protein
MMLSAVVGLSVAGCGGGGATSAPAVTPAGSASGHTRAPRSATLTLNLNYWVCPGADQTGGTIDEGVQYLGDIRAGNVDISSLPQGAAIGYKPPLSTQLSNFSGAHTSYSDGTTVQVNVVVHLDVNCQGGP